WASNLLSALSERIVPDAFGCTLTVAEQQRTQGSQSRHDQGNEESSPSPSVKPRVIAVAARARRVSASDRHRSPKDLSFQRKTCCCFQPCGEDPISSHRARGPCPEMRSSAYNRD